MNYFCDVHIQSAKDAEKRIFIVLENGTELTKDILAESNQYKDFVQTYKPKFLMADYITYSTEADVFASSQDEIFIELIKNNCTSCRKGTCRACRTLRESKSV